CGDGMMFKLCSFDDTAGYYWYPAIGLNNPSSVSPVASPNQSIEYYLRDSTGMAVDSAFIIVTGFVKQDSPNDSINCYQKAVLSGDFSPSATYIWAPVIGLSDSTVFN